MSYKVRVEGFTGLVRDTHSNAIVNTNKSDYELYMLRHKSREKQSDVLRGAVKEINTLKQELREIQERLKKNKDFLQIIEEKISISIDLMKDDLTNKLEHLTYLEKRVEIKGRIKEDYWAEKQAETGIQRAQLRIKNIEANFNASLKTPVIDIADAQAGSLVLTYDSSWRQMQRKRVLASFEEDFEGDDVGEGVTIAGSAVQAMQFMRTGGAWP